MAIFNISYSMHARNNSKCNASSVVANFTALPAVVHVYFVIDSHENRLPILHKVELCTYFRKNRTSSRQPQMAFHLHVLFMHYVWPPLHAYKSEAQDSNNTHCLAVSYIYFCSDCKISHECSFNSNWNMWSHLQYLQNIWGEISVKTTHTRTSFIWVPTNNFLWCKKLINSSNNTVHVHLWWERTYNEVYMLHVMHTYLPTYSTEQLHHDVEHTCASSMYMSMSSKTLSTFSTEQLHHDVEHTCALHVDVQQDTVNHMYSTWTLPTHVHADAYRPSMPPYTDVYTCIYGRNISDNTLHLYTTRECSGTERTRVCVRRF